MPYRHERLKTPLPASEDRRRKLTDQQRAEIAANPDGLSQRALARRFGVSRRLVQLIQDPAKVACQAEAREARGGWRRYYDRDTHARQVREHRRHKARALAAEGGISRATDRSCLMESA